MAVTELDARHRRALPTIIAGDLDAMSSGMTTGQPWPWPETMDALIAAPASHRVLLENDRVRVLEVVIEPGAREPGHTHQTVSVMIVDEPARIRYTPAARFAATAAHSVMLRIAAAAHGGGTARVIFDPPSHST